MTVFGRLRIGCSKNSSGGRSEYFESSQIDRIVSKSDSGSLANLDMSRLSSEREIAKHLRMESPLHTADPPLHLPNSEGEGDTSAS